MVEQLAVNQFVTSLSLVKNEITHLVKLADTSDLKFD